MSHMIAGDMLAIGMQRRSSEGPVNGDTAQRRGKETCVLCFWGRDGRQDEELN